MNAPSDIPTSINLTNEPGAPAALPVRRGIARLIEYSRGRHVAFPPHTTIELIENPVIIEVPGAPAYALGLMSWQGGWLPVIQLDLLLHAPSTPAPPAQAPRYALVLAYQPAPRLPVAHGAIGMDFLPKFSAVGDDAQCALPLDSPRWPRLSLSCFFHEAQPVPILDTARLFAAYHEPLSVIHGSP